MVDRLEINAIIKVWNGLRDVFLRDGYDKEREVLFHMSFISFLDNLGWKALTRGFKYVYIKDRVVLKFDESESYFNHTQDEYLTAIRSRPLKRRYLVQPLAYSRGLLFEPKISHCTGGSMSNGGCNCKRAFTLATKLKINDWYNHGMFKGRIMFFDSDNEGPPDPRDR